MSILDATGIDEIIVKLGTRILTVLKIGASAIAARVMASFGLAWVTFAMVMPDVKAMLAEKVQGLPPTAVDFLAACGVDVFMVMVLSAVASRIGFQAVLVGTNALEAHMQNAGG